MKKLRPHERGNMTKIIKKIVCFMLTVAMVLSALSTDLFEKTIYGSDFSCIVLSRYTEKMDVYEQFYLIAITSTGKKPTFSSSKSSIASVDKYGLITAKKEGKTTITVKSGKARAYCIITVNKTIITLSKTKISLQKGQTTKLTAQISSGTIPKFSSSRSSVAKIDSSGNITGVKNGTAIISVKADGQTVKCTVEIKKPTITLNSYSISMKVGETVTLTPNVSNGYKPQYSSSNSKVAKVTGTGRVTALKKGKAIITISEDGTKVKCQINVS